MDPSLPVREVAVHQYALVAAEVVVDTNCQAAGHPIGNRQEKTLDDRKTAPNHTKRLLADNIDRKSMSMTLVPS